MNKFRKLEHTPTWIAIKNDRSASQSFSISASSFLSIMGLVIEERAAVMWSERIRSTVAKNGGSSLGGGMEDTAEDDDIIKDEDSPPFVSDGERDLQPSGECNGEVQS